MVMNRNGNSRRALPSAVAAAERMTWEDDSGRKWTVLVPAGHPEEAERGMVIGPPDLSALGLPEPVAVRLHNELHARGLLTLGDLRGREREIGAALQAALHVDTAAIVSAYRG